MALLTKSLFTTSLGCPRKLYYATHGYENINSDNDFMMSLAEGGIQVGALARHYYKTKYAKFGYYYIDTTNPDDALSITNKALKEKNVVIAEAAFEWGGCFVRADIIVKRDKHIQLIEVKASSLHANEKEIAKISNPSKKNEVNSDYRKYIYDLAFQKYVIEKALDIDDLESFLMLINSSQPCDIDGLNQMVRINTKTHEVDVSALDSYKPSANEQEWMLYPCDLTLLCNKIINGETDEQATYMGARFTDYVDMLVQSLKNDTKLDSRISGACKKCEFSSEDFDKSGFHECWRPIFNNDDSKFQLPMTLELWGGGAFRKLNKLIAEKKYFFSDLNTEDYFSARDVEFHPDDEAFNYGSRRQIQIMRQGSECRDAILLKGIKDEMENWKFPLHFIDFETSTVALPFTKGRFPYETTAFQFSHHQLDEDGRLTHSEWISTKREFPNFKFVRALKETLENDEGSVFRFSHHENTVLNQIAEQLEFSNEADKQELIEFIHSITHDKDAKREGGKRDMIDLCQVVVDYFYDPSMKGSNSIKVVLPAVLRSKELQQEFEGPYRNYVNSKNFVNFDYSLINYTDEAKSKVGNPYKYLPTIGAELLAEGEISTTEDRINNGGLANANYARLQYDGLSDEEKLKLEKALLRYCELDTMAMVLIYRYFVINAKKL